MENNSRGQFFELVRAGLWSEYTPKILAHGAPVDWEAIYQLAEEQSVVGLVAAGIDALPPSERPPQTVVLQFVGSTLQLEQRNKAMNEFVAKLITMLRKNDIYALLVKGQGIAQCYEKPLWRASGDVDLLLSEDNYEKAKKLLVPLATNVESEYKALKHIGMTLDGFSVELHGTLHSRLSKRVDRVIDSAQNDVFFASSVRSWQNGGTQVFLPSPTYDVVFVFTHILHHFYIEGVGLRQICDWCRLLWTYRDSLNYGLLESRIKDAGLMTEWRAFASLAVQYLGMPEAALPMFGSSVLAGASEQVREQKFKGKADRIMEFVLESGNFGHNRQVAIGKLSSVWNKTKDFARHTKVFPLDSIKFYFHFLGDGLRIATDK